MKKQLCIIFICLLTGLTITAIQAGIDFGSEVKGTESDLCVDRYGQDKPEIIKTGYLFIDLKYMPPPYKVERIGQGVVVNGILVNCLYEGSWPTSNQLAKVARNWRDPFHGEKHDTPKTLAKGNAMQLKRVLLFGGGIFLSKTGYEKLGPFYPRRKRHVTMRLPYTDKMRKEIFSKTIEIVFSAKSPEIKLKELKKNGAGNNGIRKIEDLDKFVQSCRQSTNFMARASIVLEKDKAKKQLK